MRRSLIRHSRKHESGMTSWHRAAEVAGEIAQDWTREGGPGGAILLFDSETLRAEACGGLSSIELGLPFGADTAVRYASISKHFLAATVLLLGSALPLGDKLGEHLDGLSPAIGGVGIGHALDMTGGIPDVMETAWLLGVPITAAMDRDALLAFARRLDALNFGTGGEISYSNTGYRLVQAAIAAKGLDYREALADRFFAPLGLGITLPEDQTEPVPNLATGYWKAREGWRRGVYGMHFSASGGLAGSARDLMLWTQALLADRDPVTGLLDRLAATRHLADARPTEYGLGLAWTRLGGRGFVGHGGSLPGYKNHFLLDRDAGAGVVVLTNREDTDPHRAALRVMAALHDLPLPKPARDTLPEGLFAAPGEPAWIRHERGTLTFLGAQDTLEDGGNGWAVADSAHMPIRLRRDGEAITGEIGHVERRFLPVPADAALGRGWDGEWVCPAHDARFSIADGTLRMGAGPLHRALPLQPLGHGRALTDKTEGPWRQRACLALHGDTIRLVTNRSRILRFSRA
jgi:CubicO group peptidase (beta-lactamase class C family)